jgi:hypothetical protein
MVMIWVDGANRVSCQQDTEGSGTCSTRHSTVIYRGKKQPKRDRRRRCDVASPPDWLPIHEKILFWMVRPFRQDIFVIPLCRSGACRGKPDARVQKQAGSPSPGVNSLRSAQHACGWSAALPAQHPSHHFRVAYMDPVGHKGSRAMNEGSSSRDDGSDTFHSLNVLGHPILRQSDLRLLDDSDSATRWDYLEVVPDDDNVLVIMWWLTGSVCLVVTIFITIVLLAVLKSKPAMKFGFNVYLVALMIPDWIHTSQSALIWYLSAMSGRYIGQAACYYQSWFTYFGLGGTAWINAIVAYELWVRQKKKKRSLPRWVG